MMNTVETKNAVREAVGTVLDLSQATQIDTNEYVFPVEIEGVTQYLGCALTVKNIKGTKTVAGFNLANKVAQFEAKKAERLAKAQERIDAKALKEGKSRQAVKGE